MLKVDYTYPLIHLIRSVCFRELGDSARAVREDAIYRSLTKSIMAGGDGKSPEAAFVVVLLTEERFVLMALDIDEKMQAMATKAGRNCDRIDGALGQTRRNRSTSILMRCSVV